MRLLHLLIMLLLKRGLQLLEREPSRRLACKPREEGYEELKQQPWFQSMDWETLENKELPPPFVPDVS